MSILDDPQRLAKLRYSIGTHTHGKRPMTPIEVAVAIKDLEEASGDSLKNIANKRLHVTVDTCNLFLPFLDLPPELVGMFHFGSADGSGRMPFSLVRWIAPNLKNNKLTTDQVDLLKGAMLDPDKSATRDDIIAIIRCMTENPEKSGKQCIREIMNMTPVIVRGYLIITDIDPEIVLETRKEGEKYGKREHDVLLLKISKYFSKNSVKGVRIKNDKFVQISLDENGHKEFYNMAKKENVSANDLVNHILSKEVTCYG